MLIDDFARVDFVSALGTTWRSASDQVMGGVSVATLEHRTLDGHQCLRLTGNVRLDNNGGFVQAALPLAKPPGTLDASGYTGIRLTVRGNGEEYGVHLRTTDALRPWQSYRSPFVAEPDWAEVILPFSSFHPHRLSAPLDLGSLRRLGLVGIGRAFHADLAVSRVSLYH